MSDGFQFIEGFEGDEDSLVWQSMGLERHARFARTGSYGAGVDGTTTGAAASPVVEATVSKIAGFAFRWQSSLGLTPTDLLYFYGEDGDRTVVVSLTQQATLLVKTANDSGSLAGRAYSTFSLDEDAWYYLEVYALRHASNGRVVVQVNGPEGAIGATGAEVIDVSGIPTGTIGSGVTGYNQVAIGRMSGTIGVTIDFSFDDVYMRDGAEGFIGDNAVYLLDLEDDRSVEFTRLSGAKNYLMVNEVAPDDDTTYNESDTDGHEDVFEVADQAFTGAIHCVQLVARCRKTETEAWSLQTLLDLGGTKAYAGERYMPYPIYETRPPDVFGDAPGQTGWTLAQVNAIGVGYRVDRAGAAS